MRPPAPLLRLLPLLPLPALAAEYAQYSVYHRLYHPLLPHLQFRQRGSLHTGASAFLPAPSLYYDLVSFLDPLREANFSPDTVLYQVALDPHGNADEAAWDISSVKLCHLGHVANETFVLHTTDPQNGRAYALDYFVSPLPHDGACSTPARKNRPENPSMDPELHIVAKNIANLNASVIVRGTRMPPFPELRTPPPLTPEGQPVQPVPEKTFLQKYWMYIVVFLVVVVLSPAGEEEQPRGRAQ
ncbi:hypothetical protein AX16_001067 [Volvariella volvacea WC 439]|nr:hypothetical protein AX16_001067 [Volvariella volvacea WC 439]